MGGFNQAQAHAQFVSNIVDFGMNIQAALEAARFTKRDFDGCGVWVENGVAPDVIAGLRSQGHDVKVWPRYFQGMGRGNAVEANDSSPVHYGATDPRADGGARTNALLKGDQRPAGVCLLFPLIGRVGPTSPVFCEMWDSPPFPPTLEGRTIAVRQVTDPQAPSCARYNVALKSPQGTTHDRAQPSPPAPGPLPQQRHSLPDSFAASFRESAPRHRPSATATPKQSGRAWISSGVAISSTREAARTFAS